MTTETKKLIIVGDTHLCYQTWVSHPEIRHDSYFAFNQIIKHCLQQKAHLVLLGDILNVSRPDSRSVDYLAFGLKQILDAGLNIYYLQGQHDKSTPPWLTATMQSKQVIHIHKKAFTPIIGGPVFYGMDYEQDKDVNYQNCQEIPDTCSIVMGHATVDTVYKHYGIPAQASFSCDWLKPSVKMAIFGDYHKHLHIAYKNALNGASFMLHYTGSTYMCKEDEDKEKFIYLLDASEPDIKLTSIPLETRLYKHCKVKDLQSFEQLQKELMTETKDWKIAKHTDLMTGEPIDLKPVIFVEYIAAVIPEAINRLTAAAGDRAIVWGQPVQLRQEDVSDIKAINIDLQQHVQKFVADDTDPYKLLLELLTTTDRTACIEKWRKAYGLS